MMPPTTSPINAPELPFFDVNNPAFSVRSELVRAAREAGPYARTPYGLAVLRYAEVNKLINDKRLIQGSARWSEHNGITGDWARWWANIMMNLPALKGGVAGVVLTLPPSCVYLAIRRSWSACALQA